MFNPEKPFNELPIPPLQQLETTKVLKETITARAALAALNQALRLIPNPNVLLNSISLLEAQASSEIENIVTTTDELFSSIDTVSSSQTPAVKETMRYRDALFAGIESLSSRPLSTNTAIKVCSVIQGREMSVRNLPGTYIGDPATKKARYTPPEGKELLYQKLQDWEKFIHTGSDIDPVIIMAAAHYQFEAIHPFADGNGRCGRILNLLYLYEKGLLDAPALYLSRYIIETKAEYYDRLLAVTRDGDWEGWLLYLIKGVSVSAANALEIIKNINQVRETMRELVSKNTTAPAEFIDLLFTQPYVRIKNVIATCNVSRPTATSWLQQTVELGQLKETIVGRDKIFVNVPFMNAL